jgi:hypothetical protein
VLTPWSRKGKAARKWRSRAWSIDPKKTNLTIIKTGTLKPSNQEITDLDLDNSILNLFLFHDKGPQLPDSCTQYLDSLTDMEQAA